MMTDYESRIITCYFVKYFIFTSNIYSLYAYNMVKIYVKVIYNNFTSHDVKSTKSYYIFLIKYDMIWAIRELHSKKNIFMI